QKGAAQPKEALLEVTDLVVIDERAHKSVNGVSFTVRSGEIVGVAGVQGNGQTELVEALTGLRTPLSGSVRITGADTTNESPRQIHDRSVAHVPEDRQRSGLVLNFTVAENMVLNTYHAPPFSKGIAMDWDATNEAAQRLVAEYDVRTPSVDVEMTNLSGGNQQKVIVAREFGRDVKVVIASQPTRGLDVGSIEYIHERIVQERDEGTAILVVSTELDEVLALSDRILVMYRGKIVAEVPGSEATAADLGLYMAGSSPE
ncbi:MAG: ATP-binding cassette domain-containing protein, partial [Acidimicrobiia bacterium]|nr:ATP-binding cassette domain-containing protein [Acidimicrobiia bacterium]